MYVVVYVNAYLHMSVNRKKWMKVATLLMPAACYDKGGDEISTWGSLGRDVV